MNGISYYNSERYPDPTAYAGLTAAIKAEKAKNFKPVVYICSPYSGNIRLNTANARRYCRYAVDKGCIPIAPHLLFPQFMSEETERETAMFMNYVHFSRGYNSNERYGHAWRKIRDRYITAHPLCELCLINGRYIPADLVHHKKPLSDGGTNDESNLMSLCYSCHEKEHGGRGGQNL